MRLASALTHQSVVHELLLACCCVAKAVVSCCSTLIQTVQGVYADMLLHDRSAATVCTVQLLSEAAKLVVPAAVAVLPCSFLSSSVLEAAKAEAAKRKAAETAAAERAGAGADADEAEPGEVGGGPRKKPKHEPIVWHSPSKQGGSQADRWGTGGKLGDAGTCRSLADFGLF